MATFGIVQGVGLALLCLAVVLPSPLLEQPDVLGVLVYDPPPAAPLPLPKGSPLRPEVPRSTPPKPVVEERRRPALTVPIPIPPVEEQGKVEPETGVRLEDQFGSETGSDRGDPLGMEGGVENGMVGGLPGGMAGGLPGGTGTSPVFDYDAPPRILRQTRPRYPQEAFVKKVEGTVVLEILIDSSGHVNQARVIQSIPLLDAAARDTVYEWLFQPAAKRGHPVPAIAHAPVHFLIY